ncbi:MAG: DMT family transporter [Bacillota bacterium]|nr:DMT family transporter [Bacillota bacterium]
MSKSGSNTIVYIAAIIGSIFFGMTFLGAKIALEKLDAIEVLACRWTLAFVLFTIAILIGFIKVDFRKKPIWLALVMAFIQPCINTICETCGVDMTSTSESAIMYAMIPMAVVLISRVFLAQRIRPLVGAGIVVSFIGVFIAIAFGGGSIGALLGSSGSVFGYPVLLGMVVTGAIFIIVSGRLSDRFSAMERTFVMAAMGTVWFNGLNVVRGNGFNCYAVCFTDLKTGLAILFLGAIGSFMCYILFNYIVAKLPAAQVSSIQVNITSLTGVVTGILFQGDPFGWYTVVGMIMIIAGVIACNMTTETDKIDCDDGKVEIKIRQES